MTTSNKKKKNKKPDLKALTAALKRHAKLEAKLAPHWKMDGKIDKEGVITFGPPSYFDESTVYTAVVQETPHELDLLIHELVSWRSVGHLFSCLCHNCIPLRDKITARGDDGLYLADRYPLRYGAELWKPTCRHNVSLMTSCERCAAIWELGNEKPFPYCYSSKEGGPKAPKKDSLEVAAETIAKQNKEKV